MANCMRGWTGRWKEYFEGLMNEENERERRLDDVGIVNQEERWSKDEVRAAMKRMKSGKAVGPDDIPAEAWRCLGKMVDEFKYLGSTVQSNRECRRAVKKGVQGRLE